MRRQIITDDSRAVHALCIPYYYQSNSDWLCFVFPLKMCLEYFKNIYRDEFVRNSTPNMSVDELKQLTHSGEFTGTRIDKSLVNELTRKIPSINFTLKEECSIDHHIKNFENDLPTIVPYNCSYMLYEEPEPGHAGVVSGIIDDNDLIDFCKELSPAYTYSRYPDVPEIEDIMEVSRNLIQYAKEVLNWVERML
ncbi:MAG: HEPN domain-containing protein [Methanosarcinaceae archaeon]